MINSTNEGILGSKHTIVSPSIKTASQGLRGAQKYHSEVKYLG